MPAPLVGAAAPRLRRDRAAHHVGQHGIRPSPPQPLGQAVEADEAPLLPGLARVCAKYALAGAWLSRLSCSTSPASSKAAHRRRGAGSSNMPASSAATRPTCTGRPSQAHACDGPQLSAADNAEAATPASRISGSRMARCTTERATEVAQQARHERAQRHAQQFHGGHQRLQLELAHAAATRGRACRAATRRSPPRAARTPARARTGTAAGNSSANGHSASSTSAPGRSVDEPACARGSSGRPRPAVSRPAASTAPTTAPGVFSARSTFEGTRAGR